MPQHTTVITSECVERFCWLGYLTEAISYYDVSKEAANYFDSLIDGICCLPSARMPVKRLGKRRTQAGSY